jgi:hypothetical protein
MAIFNSYVTNYQRVTIPKVIFHEINHFNRIFHDLSTIQRFFGTHIFQRLRRLAEVIEGRVASTRGRPGRNFSGDSTNKEGLE